VALAGALAAARVAITAIEASAWARAAPEARAAWQRDARILDVAAGAREQRRQRAWRALDADLSSGGD
jgi:hypothetical protein